MCRASDEDCAACSAVVGPEGITVERRDGRGQQDEKVEARERLVLDEFFVEPDRAPFVACTPLLLRKGETLPTDADANIATWWALASGAPSASDLATWLRSRTRPLG